MNLWRYALGLLVIFVFLAFALANDELVKVNIYLNLLMEGGLKFVYLPFYVVEVNIYFY